MELYILSKQDLSILSICKLADYQINLDEETNAKSTFTLMKTNGLKKENYMVLNGLYRQFIFVIDDVQTEKESDVVTVTALDISNIFDRKVIEKNIDIMKSKSIEEFLANTISEDFVNSDDTALNVNYIEIYWHTNTQGNVATNAENGLYNFHTFLTNCRQYKNIYTDFKLENLGNPQTVEGKRISVEAKNRKIVDISLHGESTQNGTPTPDNRVEIENIEGRNILQNKQKTQTINGVTFTVNKDKSVTLSGTATADTNYYFYTPSNYLTLKKGNYTLSGVKGGSTTSYRMLIYKTDWTFIGQDIGNGLTFTLEEDANVFIYIWVKNGITVNITVYPQLEAGTVATPYVPYNSLEFKVEGKNKFDCANSRIIYNNGNTSYERLENGLKLISSGAQYNMIYFLVDTVKNLKDKTLTLSSDISFSKDNQLTTFGLFYTDINGGNRTTLVTNNNVTSEGKYQVTGQVEEGENRDYVCIGLRPNIASNFASGDYTIYDNLQVEIDETATDYEPYKSQTAYFPLSEGQKLMKGSYLADGGTHHKRKQISINSSLGNYNSNDNWYYISNSNFANLIKAGNSLSNYFTYKPISYLTSNPNASGVFSNTGTYFVFRVLEFTSAAEYRNFFTENSVIIEYDIAEPETVPYTEEQQEAWNNIKNLTLFEGVNHISSDANMVLKYYPLEPVGLKFVLRIDIENKQETTKLIDTTLPEVTDYNKVYEEDVTAKVTAYIRENNTEYNLYLKTDRTTTTNKNDPDRASGKIEVISVDTVENAPEEALNVMKGNNYKHLVEFKIAKTSKLMDITELHIGRPIRIKTDDDIYDSYISAITLSDENFVYFKSGSLRITLLDKLKKTSNTVGDKLDRTGGKITGNLDVSGTLKENGKTLLDLTYPVGSIYMSINSSNPSILFGRNMGSLGKW